MTSTAGVTISGCRPNTAKLNGSVPPDLVPIQGSDGHCLEEGQMPRRGGPGRKGEVTPYTARTPPQCQRKNSLSPAAGRSDARGHEPATAMDDPPLMHSRQIFPAGDITARLDWAEKGDREAYPLAIPEPVACRLLQRAIVVRQGPRPALAAGGRLQGRLDLPRKSEPAR